MSAMLEAQQKGGLVGAFKKWVIVLAMLGTVTIIADTIDGDMQIIKGIGAFLGELISGVTPDITIN